MEHSFQSEPLGGAPRHASAFSFDMKARTAVQCCVGGAAAAVLGYYGFRMFAPHPAENVSTSKDLLLLVCIARWIGGCVFFVTSFVWCVISEIRRRRALHQPKA